MLLPFAERAFIDDRKLVGYCLSETHLVGKHKARVFRAVLGLTAEDYQVLKDAVEMAVLLNEAMFTGSNQEGDLYVVDFLMNYEGKQASIRTAWMVRFAESFPRLVSCCING